MKRLLLLALVLCAQLAFAKGNSGIAGKVIVVICPVVGPEGCPTRPYQGQFAIYNAQGKLFENITPDPDGLFVVDLHPGTYTIVPNAPEPPNQFPIAYPQNVCVEAREYTEVMVVFIVGP